MGFKLKGFKKPFKNLTHSKIYKTLSPFGHYGSKVRKKLGLTGHRVKKLGRQLKDLYFPSVGGSSSINSAGAVIPSSLGRSVTDMY